MSAQLQPQAASYNPSHELLIPALARYVAGIHIESAPEEVRRLSHNRDLEDDIPRDDPRHTRQAVDQQHGQCGRCTPSQGPRRH